MNIWKQLRKNQEGSFTIEASLLFPMLLMITIALIFFCLVIFEKVVLHQRAQLIADRVAYVWNNSTKNPATGSFKYYTSDPNSPDGLYWRILGNNIFSKFHLDFGDGSGRVEIGQKGGSSLIERKLTRIPGSWMPSGATGEISYQNNMTGGKITVKLYEPLRLPISISQLFGFTHISTIAVASITDPVEFIRDTDFLYHYANKLLKPDPSKRKPASAIKIFK